MDFLQQRFGTPYARELPTAKPARPAFSAKSAAIWRFHGIALRLLRAGCNLLWYSRTVDAHALSGKRIGVFGAPTAAAGIARALRDELDMRVEFVGTYVLPYGDWLRERVSDLTDNVILIRTTTARSPPQIDQTRPDIVFGSQMERHSASGFGVPCAVISPPSHILNFPLSYAPFVGYDGANYLADIVNRTQVLGLEHHLIETFGPRGQGRFAEAAPEPEASSRGDGCGTRRGRPALGCGGGTAAGQSTFLRAQESPRECGAIRARAGYRHHR